MKTEERRLLLALEAVVFGSIAALLWGQVASTKEQIRSYEADIRLWSSKAEGREGMLQALKRDVALLESKENDHGPALPLRDYAESARAALETSGAAIQRWSFINTSKTEGVEFVISGRPAHFARALAALDELDRSFIPVELGARIKDSNGAVEATIRIFREIRQ